MRRTTATGTTAMAKRCQRATPAARWTTGLVGGRGYVQIREVGKEGSELWVTQGHVTALQFGKRQRVAEVLGARREAH